MSEFFIDSEVEFEFSEVTDTNRERLEKEFIRLTASEDTATSKWVKDHVNNRRSDTEKIIIGLLVELHKKIDSLEKEIKNDKKSFIGLDYKAIITSINYENRFKSDYSHFEVDKLYYGRVAFDVYPKYTFGFFFVFDDKSLKVVKIDSKNEQTWNLFVSQIERTMLREIKKS